MAMASSLLSLRFQPCSEHPLFLTMFAFRNGTGTARLPVTSSLGESKEYRRVLRVPRVTSTQTEETPHFSSSSSAKLVTVVRDGTAVSPLKSATWFEVMKHMADRLRWTDETFEMVVLTENQMNRDLKLFSQADILVGIGLNAPESSQFLQENASTVSTRVFIDSSQDLETWLGGVKVLPLTPPEKLTSVIPGNRLSKELKVLELITNAWNRRSSDNVCFMLLVLIDSYVTPVKLLKNLRATGLSSLHCMAKNCGQQILACLVDPNCRKALACLTSCAPNDQVCSYRCIVSYESESLGDFSLCVLQKHNCLGLSAEIQMKPEVEPMQAFRGQALTHSLAEDLFVGWLGKLEWSWRVVAGQNAAYDHFPNQYQLFYRGKSKGTVWYDPVFQVETLEGKVVWRRRHYRVRRGETPGTFYFSVLDNGVISREFWRIVDVADDLSWGLFYYSGAAEAAGQSYTWAVLVSPDGAWPTPGESEKVCEALERCGIKLWELYSVRNTEFSGEDMPLSIPEGSKLHESIQV